MTAPLAYSYVRFSHPDQARGDSLRRQAQAAAEWCERNGVYLDESLTLHDLGTSAYLGEHRRNPDRHALAAFLKLIERGKVPVASTLLLENLDRLSREDEVPACHLLTGILLAGVRVVQLSPYEMVLTEKSNGWELMRAVMELSRGHNESKIKSERVGAAWDEKRGRVRAGKPQKATARMGEGCMLLTHRLPGWCVVKDGRPVLVPEAARAVRLAFQLAARGHGTQSIIGRFARDKVPPIGRTGQWTRSYLARVLTDRRALGELQPRRKGRPDGAPIPRYYPAVVSESEFLAAGAGLAERRARRGRTGAGQINLFAGVLHNARGQDNYVMIPRQTRATGRPSRSFPVLINRRAAEGGAPGHSIQYAPFEAAVLSLLREIDPAEVLGTGAEPDESQALAGELAGVEAKIGELEAELEQGDVAALARVLRQLEARKAGLVGRLAEARAKAASPLSASWGEAQSLAQALASAPDPRDARLRLRTLIRRVVESMSLLVVPRGLSRLAALQVRLAGGHRRDYLILCRPEHNNGRASRPAEWKAVSLAGAEVPPLDLRDPAQAEALARALEGIDLAKLRGS